MSVCIEKKTFLSGALQEFSCELIHYSDSFGILRYVIDKSYVVAGISLSPGDITFAFYWTDRPYTLYTFRRMQLENTLYYFNIADRISLTRDVFAWRDLVIDILIDDKKNAYVLDEGDLPPLDMELSDYIQSAKTHILARHEEIAMEADRLLNAVYRTAN